MSSQSPEERQLVEDERNLQLSFSAILNEVRKLSEGLDPIIGKYELKSSEFLFGLIGALIFLISCLILHPRITASLGVATLPLIIGSAVLLGAVLGVFLFRGPARWRMERNLRRLSLRLEAFREEIKTLEGIDNLPDGINTHLWSAYEEAIVAYREVEKFSYRVPSYPLFFLPNRRR